MDVNEYQRLKTDLDKLDRLLSSQQTRKTLLLERLSQEDGLSSIEQAQQYLEELSQRREILSQEVDQLKHQWKERWGESLNSKGITLS